MDPHARAFAFVGHKSRINPIPDSLVISDSDPDSNIRTSATKPSKGQPRGRTANRVSATGSVIEISDDSLRHLSIPDIIELSDDSDSQEEIEIIEMNRTLLVAGPAKPFEPPQPRVALSTDSRFPVGATASNGRDSDSETRSIDLSRFAYTAQALRPRSRATSQGSIHSVHPTHSIRPVLPEKSSNGRIIHSACDFLTDREIALLSRCVACELAWTTKKTVPKKRHHLRICQKKNDLTDDTMHLRIEQELSRAVDGDEKNKRNGKMKEKSVSLRAPTTLMNTVVHDAQPKKRVKGKEKSSTIIGIEHQHGIIQEQARRLLAFDLDWEDSPMLDLSTTAPTTVPLTQEFPSSKFGNRKDFAMDVATPLQSLTSSDDEKSVSISLEPESRPSRKSPPLFSHASARHRDLPEVLLHGLTLHDEDDMWLDDLKREIADIESKAQWDNAESLDAWHSELHVNNMRGRRAVDDGMRSSAIKTKEKRVRKPKALSASSSAISNTPSKGRRRIREATPISVSTTKWMNMHEPGSEALHNKVPTVNILEDVDQDDFNQLMRKHIMNDKNLWQRILRYEPVDFMEFFDIAVAVGVPRNFVTHRLRAFLTSKAIQVSPSKTRKHF